MAVYERSWFQNLEMAAKNDIKNDPCFYEGKASMKCVIDNAGDKTQCQQYFDSYKNARSFGMMSMLVEDELTSPHSYLQLIRDRNTSKNMCKQKKFQYHLMMIRPNDDLS